MHPLAPYECAEGASDCPMVAWRVLDPSLTDCYMYTKIWCYGLWGKTGTVHRQAATLSLQDIWITVSGRGAAAAARQVSANAPIDGPVGRPNSDAPRDLLSGILHGD